MAHANSLTGQYLSGKREIPLPARRRDGSGEAIEIVGAKHNNLQERERSASRSGS